MTERLFDHNSDTGVTTWLTATEENGGTWHFRREQDVTPIIEDNKATQSEGFDRRANMWHAGHIPQLVIDLWRDQYGVDIFNKNHMPAVKRLLNSNEFRDLRPHLFTL